MALQFRLNALQFESEQTRPVYDITVQQLLRTRDSFNQLQHNTKILDMLAAFWFEKSQIPFLQSCSEAANLQKQCNYFQ